MVTILKEKEEWPPINTDEHGSKNDFNAVIGVHRRPSVVKNGSLLFGGDEPHGWRWWAGMADVGWACGDLVALGAQGGVEGLGAMLIFDMRAPGFVCAICG